MTALLTTIDPWDVEDGVIINPAPGRPGVVVSHDIDDRDGRETYHLGDGRDYEAWHGIPVQVILTEDIPPGQARVGDLIAAQGWIVRVVRITQTLGVLAIRWASDARRPDGTPAVTGITTVRPEEQITTWIRLIDRPATLTEVAR